MFVEIDMFAKEEDMIVVSNKEPQEIEIIEENNRPEHKQQLQLQSIYDFRKKRVNKLPFFPSNW